MKPRIGDSAWDRARPNAYGIFNNEYLPSGAYIGPFERPWTLLGPRTYEQFTTHAEALAHALQKAGL